MWIKRNKVKVVLLLCCVLSLTVAFFMGGTPQADAVMDDTEVLLQEEPAIAEEPPLLVEVEDDGDLTQQEDATHDLPLDQETEPEIEHQQASNTENEVADTPQNSTVTLLISCEVVLNQLDNLDESKWSIIPEDGIFYQSDSVVISEGTTVFDVLLQVTQSEKIHMEYSSTPIYNSAYIEGIGNLYEWDCGPLSGWIYKVNGVSPNYGCSQYILENGDEVEILYTCDLGADVGGQMVGDE